MASCRLLLLLLCAWSHAHADTHTDTHTHRRRRGSDPVPDTLTEHMRRLYARYTRPGHVFKDGNTVRSFKAHWGVLGSRRLQIFNLTSLRSSESVLSATLHFFSGERPRHAPGQLHVWSFGSEAGPALGHVRLSLPPVRAPGGAWQWRDVTRLVQAAAGRQDQLLLALQPPSLAHPPYILLYANDSAIAEPESVVHSLQRHHLSAPETTPHNHLAPPETAPHNHSRTPPPARPRRSVNLLSPLQNNELPEYPPGREEYPPGREEYPPYSPSHWDQNKAEAPNQRRPKKKSRKEGRQKVALLQFDERTMKKARRKWAEPRGCSRRYLKVDFADIGWSDWIISPKAYDAFYCAGSCHFPMNKALKPSNHATIQSIVRAVGVVPGIPEPCCVPEKMSSLSILFFDEQANVVLKVYPNMSVESCACR